jgi:sulfide:quinone oxidoreductase
MSADRATVLIAGGGVAALEAALTLGAVAGDRLDVTLVAPEPRFWYRPTAVAEPFELGMVQSFDLSALAREAAATLVRGRVVAVDASRQIAHTEAGGAIEYSMLLIACGAVPVPAIEGAVTFRGPSDTELIKTVLGEIGDGTVRRIAFVVPTGAVWNLPAYELALMTAAWALGRGIADLEVAVVTPEDEPLQLFGRDAGAAVRGLLAQRGIVLHTRSYAAEVTESELLLVGGDTLAAERVVALPRLRGPRIAGVSQTFDGFIPVDQHGCVLGGSKHFAAGDITTFPVKQGGIAAQQAEAAAEAIAAAAGVELEPRPFRPVLRGVLLTGGGPWYLRGELAEGEQGSYATTEPLWWPPAKIMGRHLAPFLARVSGTSMDDAIDAPVTGVQIDVELPAELSGAGDVPSELVVGDASSGPEAPTVEDVMDRDPLLVAPEDTVGEVAARMTDLDVGSALVVEYGRLVGIVTSRDMLRVLAGRAHPSEARVREWMTAEPISVAPTATREAARLLMTTRGIHHLPVVDGDHPVGMVGLRQAVCRTRGPMAVGLGL